MSGHIRMMKWQVNTYQQADIYEIKNTFTGVAIIFTGLVPWPTGTDKASFIQIGTVMFTDIFCTSSLRSRIWKKKKTKK